MSEVRADPLAEAWKTDVKKYFGSIDHYIMVAHLNEWRCDFDAISLVMNMIREWANAGLVGLPIGPELSAVLGNALLMQVDVALAGEGLSHYRYMDDVVVVGRDLDPDSLAATFDSALAPLRLSRNDDKTDFYSPGRAEEALEDAVLSYLNRGAEVGQRAPVDELVEVLEAEADEPYPNERRVRFALRGLDRWGNGSALDGLCKNSNLLNADPRETCAYLARHGLRTQRVRDTLMEAVTSDGGDRALALRLHAARAASLCPWGGSEGRAFIGIATDTELPSPLRAHAWQALARTPVGKPIVAMEAAVEEKHPLVRRAAVLTLRHAALTPTQSAFLKKLGSEPYVKYAAMWAQAE